jgi:hypothetical protein
VTEKTIATLLLMAVPAAGQTRERNAVISVTFAVDGKTVACNDLKVDLRLDGRHIVPTRTGGGFTVPPELNRTSAGWSPDQKIDVRVGCGEFRDDLSPTAPGHSTD